MCADRGRGEKAQTLTKKGRGVDAGGHGGGLKVGVRVRGPKMGNIWSDGGGLVLWAEVCYQVGC